MLTHNNSIGMSAAAKINLVLEVRDKRLDGFHEIRSVLMPVSLCDRLTIHRTDGAIDTRVLSTGSVAEDRLALASPDDNLATRAARLLQRHTGSRFGALIELEKHIPSGGGLGGGSADAAAVLRGCNTLWESGLSTEELVALGGELGSDVPAQVCDCAVVMAGRGEQVAPIVRSCQAPEQDAWWLVLLNPGLSVATRDIYERYKPALTFNPPAYKNMTFAVQEGILSRVAGLLRNDLQATVTRKYPLIAMLLERLETDGALGCLLSGSGGCVFGLARDEGHARKILAAVRAALGAGLWGRVVRMLPDGVMAAHGPLEARV